MPPTSFTVTTPDDTGAGSLREAIIAANADLGANIIDIRISSYAVTPSAPLPVLIGDVAFTGDTLQINGSLDLGSANVTFDGRLNVQELQGAGGSLSMGSDLTVFVGGSYAGDISGAGRLFKDGLGTLTLSGANTFTGRLAVGGGTLILDGGSAIADSGWVTVSTGATLQLNAAETVGDISGAGAITLGAGLTAGGDGTSTTY